MDFNDKVKKDQLLAEVDPLIPKAQRDQAKASLDCANANLLQAEAKLEQAKRDWKRAKKLLPAKGHRRHRLRPGQGHLRNGQGERGGLQGDDRAEQGGPGTGARPISDYTESSRRSTASSPTGKSIRARPWPRSFRRPCCSWSPPTWRRRVYVLASVDEADIGMIREAQSRKRAGDLHGGRLSQGHVPGKDRPGPPHSDHGSERRHLYRGRRSAEPGTEAPAGHDGQPVVSDREAHGSAENSQRGAAVLSRSPTRSASATADSGRHVARQQGKPDAIRRRRRAPTTIRRRRIATASSATSGSSTAICCRP